MSLNLAKCEGCKIDGKYNPMETVGSEDAPILVVTNVPSQAAEKDGRLIGYKTLQRFQDSMGKKGFTQDDFQFIPMCHCAYEENEYNNKDKREIHKHCRIHFVDHIKKTKPTVIMPLGAAPASHTFGKGTKITKVKGLPHKAPQFNDAAIFPLLDPVLVVRYPQDLPIFEADVASFARFVDADFDYDASAHDERGDWTIVDDLQFLIDMKAEVIAFDTENTSLRWYQQGCDVRSYKPALHENKPEFIPRAQILTMQFCVEPGKAFMLVWDHPEKPIPEWKKPKLRNQLRQLLCNPDTLVVGQNLKYDCVYLWMLEGIRFKIGGDSMMLTTLVDENSMEKNLDYLTKIHSEDMAGYADHFNVVVNKSRMWEQPLSALRPYGCGDADATMRVYLELEEKVADDEGLLSHYLHVSLPGLNALAGLETGGMLIDPEQAEALEVFLTDDVRKQYVSLIGQVHREIKRKHVDDKRFKGKAEDALKFSRTELLRDILFDHPKGLRLTPKVFTKSTKKLREDLQIPSTSAKDHLPFFFDREPFTFELAQYVKDERLLSANIVGFKKKYVVGGMVRPVYWLTTAVTGRTASSDPNGQNYPKRSKRAKEYRKIFTAPEGYYIVELDLSQAELRIAASMSGDPTMIRIYKEGGDIHRATALIVKGMTEDQFSLLPLDEQKEARQKAKAVNFGFLYGMGWRKFITYAKTDYNVVFTEQEAQRIRKGFFQKYHRLDSWHKEVRRFANKHKHVRSYTGRIRHLPMIDSEEEWVQQEAERQAINSPVQETGSSIGVMTLGRMAEELDPEYIQPVGFIHDAIVLYIRKEYLEWGVKTVKRYMETNPLNEWFGNEIKVPIIADAGFGMNLGSIHELPNLRLDRPYDFSGLVGKDGKPLIVVPSQVVPPNEGRLTRSPYTLPSDLEPESGPPARRKITRGPQGGTRVPPPRIADSGVRSRRGPQRFPRAA